MPSFGPISSAPVGAEAPGGGSSPGSTVTSVTVTPTSITQVAGTVQFTVTVNGTLSPSQATTAVIVGPGSINSSNLYPIPAQTGVTQTATITWTSVQDPTKSASATVSIPAAGQIAFQPAFYRSVIMRTSKTDPTAALTATLVYNIGDTNSLVIYLTRPDNTTAALIPTFGTTPLVTVDQGTFAAYQYSVYNFSPLDINQAGTYHMRHVYVDANGSIVSSDSSFTVT